MESYIYNEFDTDLLSEVWWVSRSPHLLIYGLIAYIYFVLHLGPQLMKNRPAFTLHRILVGYNLYQAIYNLWLCWELILVTKGLPCITTSCCACQNVTSEGARFTVSELGFLYWISKVVDLLDTVFFVLRKKFNQVTFLHVYHHVAMVALVWFYFKYSAGNHCIFVGLVNTFVHVVMYSYYLISALGPKYQKFLWWKKYVTWLQLFQFGLILVYLVTVSLMDCGISYLVVLFFSSKALIFILLFSNFYKKAYKKNTSKVPSKIE